MLLLSVVFCATAMFCKEQGITVIVSKWTLAFTKIANNSLIHSSLLSNLFNMPQFCGRLV
jgi:hypothetical protein